MRVGFDSSFKRRALLAVVAVAALTLIVAPAALADGHMWIQGKVVGTYYNGSKPLSAPFDITVTIPTPGAPTAAPVWQCNSLVETAFSANPQPVFDGSFFAAVTFPATFPPPTYYAETYFVNVSGLDYFSNSQNTNNTVGFTFQDNAALAVYLKLAVLNTTVKGVVKSAKTHKPLSGVKVQVGNKSAKTNKAGNYKIVISLWPKTSYKATFSKSHYKTVKKSFTSVPGGTKTINLSLKKS